MELNNEVKEGVKKAGLIPQQFNTIGVRLESTKSHGIIADLV
jgi:hypothetical protein